MVNHSIISLEQFLSLDISDATGERKHNVTQNIHKFRIDHECVGNEIVYRALISLSHRHPVYLIDLCEFILAPLYFCFQLFSATVGTFLEKWRNNTTLRRKRYA